MKKLGLKKILESARSDYNITGAAGEFLVAAELSRRNIVATLTIKNAPLIDIIASNLTKGKVANIQVKTRSERNKQGWRLNKKVEIESKIKNHFYVFAKLNVFNSLPEYWMVPYNIFAKFQRKKHLNWLNKKDKKGFPHKDNDIRNFKPESEDLKFSKKYKNNWKILNII